MAGSLRQSVKLAVTRASGSEFFVSKTLISSNNTVAAQNLTSVASGRIYIYDIVLKTDSTGLAGGTNFVISTTNAKGTTTVLAETVTNLGANKTVSMQNPKTQASLNSNPTVLEAGAKLQFATTVAAGTGAGTIDIIIYCVRVDENAQLTNA